MFRLRLAFALAFTLGGLSAAPAWADGDFCVTEEQAPCADTSTSLDLAAVAPDANVAVDATDAQAEPAVMSEQIAAPPTAQPQGTITTRTIGPPTVVNPFAGTAAPAAAQPDVAAPVRLPPDPQRLPPGPPNRLP